MDRDGLHAGRGGVARDEWLGGPTGRSALRPQARRPYLRVTVLSTPRAVARGVVPRPRMHPRCRRQDDRSTYGSTSSGRLPWQRGASTALRRSTGAGALLVASLPGSRLGVGLLVASLPGSRLGGGSWSLRSQARPQAATLGAKRPGAPPKPRPWERSDQKPDPKPRPWEQSDQEPPPKPRPWERSDQEPPPSRDPGSEATRRPTPSRDPGSKATRSPPPSRDPGSEATRRVAAWGRASGRFAPRARLGAGCSLLAGALCWRLCGRILVQSRSGSGRPGRVGGFSMTNGIRVALVLALALGGFAGPVGAQGERPDALPYTSELPDLDPGYRRNDHKVVLIREQDLLPRTLTLEEGPAGRLDQLREGALGRSSSSARPRATMICHSLVNFSHEGRRAALGRDHAGRVRELLSAEDRAAIATRSIRPSAVRGRSGARASAIDGEIIVGNPF